MSSKRNSDNTLRFPFEGTSQVITQQDAVVKARAWRLSLRRALVSLSFLEKKGYDSSRFLREVLLSFDGMLAESASSHPQEAAELYERALGALLKARKSKRLKRLMRTRDKRHSDVSCVLLRRAVLEMERIAGSLKELDLNDSASRDLLRTKLMGVLMSLITAEQQVPELA